MIETGIVNTSPPSSLRSISSAPVILYPAAVPSSVSDRVTVSPADALVWEIFTLPVTPSDVSSSTMVCIWLKKSMLISTSASGISKEYHSAASSFSSVLTVSFPSDVYLTDTLMSCPLTELDGLNLNCTVSASIALAGAVSVGICETVSGLNSTDPAEVVSVPP